MRSRSKSHLQKLLVAASFAAAVLIVGSCSTGVNSGSLDTDDSDPLQTAIVDDRMNEVLAELTAAAEAAEACRKMIDKPLRCLP